MNENYPFVNCPLSYGYDALSPYIDKRTMEVHHNRVLQGYVENLNQLLKDCPEYQKMSLEQLVLYAECMPSHLQTPVRDNAGGVYNHIFYFSNLKQYDDCHPTGPLASAIDWQFGSFENFQKVFTNAALSVFGSGYAWLILDAENRLAIRTTTNQDTPLLFNVKPLLALDVWEHAYFLTHYNMREAYVKDWFHIINWEQVGRNYAP
ncbi:superoxide dismutase [Lachnospiraceae bacterium JLR.KK008]